MQLNFSALPTLHTACHDNDNRDGGSVDCRIRAFLSGDTDGEDVLHALYGAVIGERMPARLRDTMQHCRC